MLNSSLFVKIIKPATSNQQPATSNQQPATSNQQPLSLVAYLLFFLITLTSLFGFTETLTGSHAESTQPLLFGLSFYTATLAYFVINNQQLTITGALKASNPILLATGPIALFIKNIRYKGFKKRFNYFFPFILVGAFYYQIIAVPLTESFKLIEATDLVSALVFATIFELFVYANFCGLSLIIYGLFGLLGFKVPLNFKQPFSSNNIIDFWKGWHTSLSTVLKSLFYAPLRKKFSSSIALLGVYLASAMWHGVAFNFVLWGVFHALIFIFTIKLLKAKVRFLPLVLFILGVVLGRLLFSDSDTGRLLEKLKFSYDGLGVLGFLKGLPNTTKVSLLLGFGLIGLEFFFRNTKIMAKRNYKFLRTPLALFILVSIGIVFANQVGVDFAVYGQR
ncbi:MBOAT family O-acyltransferase [Marinospirillum insulare]|uniref:MBOAT family O-acyltransferase n=1 Tax=Marinospirillum insulare TaxID=217169 RepID=UPI0012371390|nr:MBOAT family O-acyltransferase [Marinospirillum insulare]